MGVFVLCSGCLRDIQSDSGIKSFIINTYKKECEARWRIESSTEMQNLIDNYGDRLSLDEELNGYNGIEGVIRVVNISAPIRHSYAETPMDEAKQVVVFDGDIEHCAAVAKIYEDKSTRQNRANEEEAFRVTKLEIEQKKESELQIAKAEEQRAKADKLRVEDEQAESARKLTPAYKASEAARQILYAQSNIQLANKVITEENEIGLISGAVNLNRLHDAGSMIVFSNSIIGSQWDVYKANGGKASSINELLTPSNK